MLKQRRIFFYSSGQALIAVILVMVVALTIGLSVATRNITNLRLTTEEQSSQRALSAAEAGIERALKNDTNLSGVAVGTGAKIDAVTVQSISGSEFILNNKDRVNKDDPIDIWLSDYGTGSIPTYANPWRGWLYVYWHSETAGLCTDGTATSYAALDITAISVPASGSNLADAVVRRYAVDPCTTRKASNNFCPNSGTSSLGRCKKANNSDDGAFSFAPSASGVDIGGKLFYYRVAIAFGIPAAPQAGMLLRITPLYADTTIAIRTRTTGDAFPGTPLPAQGSIIDSTGSSGSTQRKISVYRAYPKIPSELFYTIFSP